MSTPDPLADGSAAPFDADTAATLNGYDALADPAITQAGITAAAGYDELEKSSGKAADTALAEYQKTTNAVERPPVQSQFMQPEVQDHFAETQKVMPFLFAMAALGGKVTKASGMSMLGAMTGMQKGLIQGDQQAYQTQRQKYEDAYRKWREDWESKRDTYEMYLKAYGPRIDASKVAWEKAEKLHDDVSLAKAKAMGDARTWARIADGHLNATTNALKQKADQLFHEKEAAVAARNAATRELAERDKTDKTAKREVAKNKSIDSVIAQLDKMDAALDKTAGITGVSGMARRGFETAKTVTGLGDQSTPANEFATASNLMLSELPVALGLSSRTAKDQRDRIAQAADMLEKHKTGPIAKAQIKVIKDILLAEQKDTAAPPAAPDPNVRWSKDGRRATKGADGKWTIDGGPPSTAPPGDTSRSGGAATPNNPAVKPGNIAALDSEFGSRPSADDTAAAE